MLLIVTMRGTVTAVPPLLIFDAPSLLYRAFYALPDSITEPAGERPVNALLGSVNLVLFEWEAYRPRAVVACFGPDAAPYRVQLYAPYHADRPPMPDGLVWQWERAYDFYEQLGWTVARDETVEADDLLGSYAQAEVDAGGEALIFTGDRDMYQCVGDGVKVLFVKTGQGRGAELVDADEVRERYGVGPDLVPDFIALRGDPSDGLPGAKGIGPKTAAELLRDHGSLEGAIEAAQKVTGPLRPRVAEALRDHADELRTFREIAKLRTIDVTPPPDAPLQGERGAAAARELGMNRLAERLANMP
jgi:5'-3' exonuclease